MFTPLYQRTFAPMLLCLVLFQSCQSRLNALEEEVPSAALAGSEMLPKLSDHDTLPRPPMRTLSPPTLSLSSYFSSTTASVCPTYPPVSTTTSPSPMSPPAALRSFSSRSRSKQQFSNTKVMFSQFFPSSSGAWIHFQAQGSTWKARVAPDSNADTPQRLLPVVSPIAIGPLLTWLQSQSPSVAKARIHLIPAALSPNGFASVYLGKLGLLGGMPRRNVQEAQEEEHTNKEQTLRDQSQQVTLLPLTQTSHNRPKDVLPLVYGGYRAFGAQAWHDHLGIKVDSEPALPDFLASQLEDTCPFWPPKKVRETHLLTLIPGKIDGEDYTLNRLGALFKSKFSEFSSHEDGFRFYSASVKAEYGNSRSNGPYWVLMTYDVIPEGRNKSYTAQQALIRDHPANREHHLDYVLPLGLEAATSIMTHYAASGGTRLYRGYSKTYTRCHPSQPVPGVFYGSYSCIVVGGFGPEGLLVYQNFDFHFNSVACCRKF